MWFTWILRACVYRLKEEFLCSAPVEDTQIKIEETKFLNDLEVQNNLIPFVDQIDCLDSGQFKISSYHELSEFFSEKLHDIIFHVLVGNQIIIQNENRSLVYSIIELLEVIARKF